MKIESAIEASTLTLTLPELVQNARVKPSFWGKRYIEIKGYEGTASIDILAKKIISLVGEMGFVFSPIERLNGKNLAEKITQLYRDSDRQVKESNFFTHLLYRIRDFIDSFPLKFSSSHFCSSIRWAWKERDALTYSSVFDYYTANQYQEKFGQFPEGIPEDFNFYKYFCSSCPHLYFGNERGAEILIVKNRGS